MVLVVVAPPPLTLSPSPRLDPRASMASWTASSSSSAPPYPPARPPRAPSLLPFLLTSLLFALTAYCVLSPRPARLVHRLESRLHRLAARALARVPVPAALQAPTDLSIAIRSFSSYSHAQGRALTRKWAAFDRMSRTHRRLGAQLGWKDTLARAEDAVEVNAAVADELAALGLEQARCEGIPVGLRSRLAGREDGRVVEVCWLSLVPPPLVPPSDSLGLILVLQRCSLQTLKHFVRDWSHEGKSERDALFPPVLDALRAEFGDGEREGKKVLVPGCGLGRLAHDIALEGFSVDANDCAPRPVPSPPPREDPL